MHWNQLQKTWRSSLVTAMQERYELTEPEARKKVNAWLHSVAHAAQVAITCDVSIAPELTYQRRQPRPPDLRAQRQMTTKRRSASA
jgi:hypothetical protein